MSLKLQLVNDYFGTCEIDDYDPANLDDFTEAVIRGKDLGNDGVMSSFSTELKFPEKSRDFLEEVYNMFGIEGVVVVNIYELNPNNYNFFRQATGKIKFANFKRNEVFSTSNLDQIGFNVEFLNLIDQNISFKNIFGGHTTTKNGTSISVPDLAKVRLQSKTILKEFNATSDRSNPTFIAGAPPLAPAGQLPSLPVYWAHIDMSNVRFDEIETRFPYGWTVQTDPDIFFTEYDFIVKESGVLEVEFIVDQAFNILGGFPIAPNDDRVDINLNLQIRNSSGAIVSNNVVLNWVYDPGFGTTPAGAQTYHAVGINVNVGDKIYLYLTIVRRDGLTDITEIDLKTFYATTRYSFKYATTFEDTEAYGLMAYELCERLTQTYTNQQDCFRSSALGRTDSSIPYGEDGFAALTFFTTGWALRQLAFNNGLNPEQNRDISFNFKEVMDTICKVWGLSWGFELFEGRQIVRVEKKSYFFNKELLILDLGEVGTATEMVEESVDISRYSKEISFGYPTIKQIKQVNSIDEFNQGRIETTPLTQVKDKLDLTVAMRGSGAEIEEQRRQSVTSEDSPLDEDKFILAVLRDGEPVAGIQGWKNERVEHFTGVTNLYDASTSMNLRISPMRNFYRWLDTLSANVYRGSNKLFQFAPGTGNYNMSSKLDGGIVVSEKQDVDCTGIEPLFEPTIYTFSSYLTIAQWITVMSNPYGYFTFMNRNVKCYGFLDNVTRKNSTKETTFQLLKAVGIKD